MLKIATLALVTLVQIGCAPREPESVMPARIQECYAQPVTIGTIFGRRDILDASSLQQLRERLDSTGIGYTLHTPDPALSLPTPRCPACQSRHYDRVIYLIVERSRRERALQRFRIYLDGERPICIEDDFSYKNPYEH